jgi:transcriptional regulator with XRE-family HTH domain
MSNAELARLLGVSEAWTTRRLGKRADTPLNMVDMQRIAAVLKVPLAAFFTPEIRDAIPPAIPRYLDLTVRTDAHVARMADRPLDNRPSGKPGAAGPTRTAFVTRKHRGRRD